MDYDAAHGQVVLFGGDGFDDTWTWDGTTWTQRTPPVSPAGRIHTAMAYDAAHGQVVLFGGFGNGVDLNDTWTWDGTTWTQQTPAASPPPRSAHAMAYDAAHGQVVLFGGVSLTNTADFNDTWTWDGTNWTQHSPSPSPSKRYGSAMTYDIGQGQAVLFGGYNLDANIDLNDTWTWDGSTWTQQTPVTSPISRFFHAMAYDAGHGQVVLFGGRAPQDESNDTWTLGLSPPTAPQAVSATAGSVGKISVSWQPLVDDGGSTVTRYNVYRAIGPAGLSLLATTPATQLSYADSGCRTSPLCTTPSARPTARAKDRRVRL